MLTYTTKDITTVTGNVIIMHGVNCQNVMGSGVAKALYTKWPIVKEQYHSFSKYNVELGIVQTVKVTDDTWVFNCFTQEFYGRNKHIKYASVDAVKECLNNSFSQAKYLDITDVYMPRIGCGLGGLDWYTEVLPEVMNALSKYPQIKLTVCDL